MVAELIGVNEVTAQLLQRAASVLNEQLAAGNIPIKTCTVAGNDPRKLQTAISKALDRCDVILTIGGLGPNPADITKETVGAFLDRRMVLHKDSLERIKNAYARAGRQMPKAINKLAVMPEQSVVFPGQKGITPGCAVSLGKKHIIMLPGAEKEYVPMARACVLPYLSRFGDAPKNTRVINVFGLTEDRVRSIVAAKYAVLRNPTVSVHAKDCEVQVEIATRAGSKTEAAALSAPVIKELLGALKENAYGVDQADLQSVVVGALRANRMTVAVGEAGAGGLLTDLFEQVEPSGKVFLYGAQAETDHAKNDRLGIPEKFLKKYGSVSPQTAVAMANGAMEEGGADIGIAVAGESGGKSDAFYVAVCDHTSAWTAKLAFPAGSSAAYAHRMAAMTALDLARRVIAALPKRYQGATPLQLALSGKIKAADAEIPPPPDAAPKKPKKEKKKKKKGGGFFAAIFPVWGDSFGEVVRKLVLVVAICTFIGSAGYLGVFYYQSFSNKQLSTEMANQYEAGVISSGKLEIPDDYPKDYQRKFGNLYAINPDVGGWLKIPDTQVNYPVVYYEPDNNWYSRRDFTRKYNRHGVPWIESRCTLDPQSDNYVIYGHNMADGQMFGELIKYKPGEGGLEFLQAHPVISMDDVYRDNEYKIISVFISNTNPKYGDVFYYNYFTDLSNEQNFNNFVSEVTERSYYLSNVDVLPGDKFITLSTCSYEYGPVSDEADVRTVVVGRRIRKGEKSDGSDITYQVNPSPKMPSGFTREIEAGAHAGPVAQYIEGSAAGGAAQQSVQPSQDTFSESGIAVAAMAAVIAEQAAGDQAAFQAALKAASDAEKASSEVKASSEASEAASSQAAEKAAAEKAASEAASARAASSQAALKAASEAAASQAALEAASQAAESSRQAAEAAEKAASEKAAAAASREAALEAEIARKEQEALRLAALAQEEEEAEEETEEDDFEPSGSANDKLTINSGGKITGTAAELIPQIVMNEMGSGFSAEAIKAQAVAVYSFIKQQNASGVVPSLGTRQPSADVKKACSAVLGEAVYSGSSIAFTPFFATSAGVTVASSDVWGGSYSYLVSVDSSVDQRASGFEKSVTYSADEVARKVKSAMKVDLYDYSDDPGKWFSIEEYTDGGEYVKTLRVGNKTTTGRAFREQVMNLRSAAFDIDFDGSRFTFTTRGYGHGVGLSQTGANFYAQQGWSYVEILEHYYPGTRVR